MDQEGWSECEPGWGATDFDLELRGGRTGLFIKNCFFRFLQGLATTAVELAVVNKVFGSVWRQEKLQKMRKISSNSTGELNGKIITGKCERLTIPGAFDYVIVQVSLELEGPFVGQGGPIHKHVVFTVTQYVRLGPVCAPQIILELWQKIGTNFINFPFKWHEFFHSKWHNFSVKMAQVSMGTFMKFLGLKWTEKLGLTVLILHLFSSHSMKPLKSSIVGSRHSRRPCKTMPKILRDF